MSHYSDETYDVYRETHRTARKPHTCAACKETIRVGDQYTVVGIVWEGEGESVKRCLRCQTIHEHLRKMSPGEQWPAERLDCGEEYEEHWGEKPPEDIAALAFATPDEMQQRVPSARKAVGRG